MVEIQVRTGGGEYPVIIGRSLYENRLPAVLDGMAPPVVAVVSHDSIMELHGTRLRKALTSCAVEGMTVIEYLFPEGEENKNLRTVEEGYGELLAAGFNRESAIVAFGGGVVGDLAGYMAATFMRGTRLLQLPTTLMSMVDSSIGGKVGVDLPEAKNAVGAFYQPLAVFSDIAVLETLPERELRSGLVEVAKYGFLYEEKLLQEIGTWDGGVPPGGGDDISDVIAVCAGCKAEVVAEDERDVTGKRAVLNYGHTFGHALEAATGYSRLRHGEAVGMGMMMAARLSELSGLAQSALTGRHREVLGPILKDVRVPEELDTKHIVRHMRSDKKRGRVTRFVLLEKPQVPRVVDSPGESMVIQAVDEVLREWKGGRRCR